MPDAQLELLFSGFCAVTRGADSFKLGAFGPRGPAPRTG